MPTIDYSEQLNTIISLLEELIELVTYSNSIGISIYAWLVFAIVVGFGGYAVYLILKPLLYFVYKY